METVGLFTALSFGITKAVDTVRNAIDLRDRFPKVVWNIVAFGIAIAVSFGTDLNILGEVAAEPLGKLFTAVALTGGSGFGHELMDMLSARGHPGNPKDPTA